MNNKQYPLSWPPGWKRTQEPQRSRFEPGSVYSEFNNVTHQLRLMGATGIVISSNMAFKLNGTPYARQNVVDTGVVVYFKRNGREQCIPCDKWYRLEDNLRAIWKSVEALRGLSRWGADEFIDAAFTGFTALPESIVTPHKRAWHEVLEVSPSASAETIKVAYKARLQQVHPDKGGSDADFIEVQNAYKESQL